MTRFDAVNYISHGITKVKRATKPELFTARTTMLLPKTRSNGARTRSTRTA